MDDIERALEALRQERTLDRINPTNPICPGCGRHERADFLVYPVTLLSSVTVLCCAECLDDQVADMSLSEYCADLIANWQPIGHMSMSTRYRGILLPPDFYNGIEVQ